MSLEALVEISRYYGKNPDYVLAGGGNTSWKDGGTLFVKGSGMSLSDVDSGSFVMMDRNALGRIWEQKYPESSAEREAAVLADMMAARKSGEEAKRPSVETLLHDIMPFDYVVHLHPALVNGLTCSQRGEAAVAEIFGGEEIWIPSINPGYVLSRAVKTALDKYCVMRNKPADIIFLQNHGIFVGSGSIEGIKERYNGIMAEINVLIKRHLDFSDEERSSDNPVISKTAETLSRLAGGATAFMRSREITALVKDRAAFYPVSSAFTPDHIVYAGSDPLFVEASFHETSFTEAALQETALFEATLQKAWKTHAEKTQRNPKIVAVQGLGVFGVATTEKAAVLALDLFKDAAKVAAYSESFGGPLFMANDKIDFINNWEVERFRTGVSTK